MGYLNSLYKLSGRLSVAALFFFAVLLICKIRFVVTHSSEYFAEFHNLTLVFLYIIAAGWSYILTRWIQIDRNGKRAFLIFIVISLIYLFLTAPDQRTRDVFAPNGHADYIKHIALKGSLPAMGSGLEYHQPPLYYILSAMLFVLIDPLQGRIPWQVFQGMNWVTFQLFILIGLKFIHENLKTRFRPLAYCLFALWPLNMVHAARIGNDILAYLFAIITLLYLFRFCRSGSGSDLFLSVAYLSIGSFVKSIILPLSLGVLCAFLHTAFNQYREGKDRQYAMAALRQNLIVISILAFCTTATFIPKFKYYLDHRNDTSASLLFPGVKYGGTPMTVPYTHFIPLYSLSGLSEPFLSSWEDRLSSRNDQTGHRNLWTYMFKSALTDIFSSKTKISIVAAYIYMYGAFLIPVLVVLGITSAFRQDPKRCLCLAVCCMAGVIGLAVVMLSKSYAYHQNFRFIYYLTAPLSVAVAWGIIRIRWPYIRVIVSSVVGISVIAGNVLILRIAHNL